MNLDLILTLIIIGGIFASLIKNILSPSVSFLLALCFFTVFGVISTEEALSGFSNQNLITIGSLFVLAKALQKSVDQEKIVRKILGDNSSLGVALTRLSITVAPASAFINNTPVVAMMINPLVLWSRKNDIAVTKLLIPLSYMSLFGGALTLIGTSTNLVVSGLLSDAGYGGLSFFEITKYSALVALFGLTATIIFSKKLLPDIKFANLTDKEIEKSYTVDTQPNRSIVGLTVSGARLRNLKNAYLGSIVRDNGDIITPVRPDSEIQYNDILRFVGNEKSIIKLTRTHALTLAEQKHLIKLRASNTYYEVVVGHNQSLVGKTLTEIGFRSRYNAAVIAIFRSGHRIEQPLGGIKLNVGDSLIVASGEDFYDQWVDKRDFLYIRQLSRAIAKNQRENWRLAAVFFAMIISGLLGTSLPFIALTGALLAVVLGILSTAEARNSVDFDLLLMIGAAFGVALAVKNSGLAESLSNALISSLGQLGLYGLLFGVVLATVIITESITNNAAALLVFPIALQAAVSSGYEPRLFAIAIAITASLSFISPFGYQTNTMVYSAGGYKFTDFVKIGVPISIISILSLMLSFIIFN